MKGSVVHCAIVFAQCVDRQTYIYIYVYVLVNHSTEVYMDFGVTIPEGV